MKRKGEEVRMSAVLQIAEMYQEQAREILRETRLLEIWESVGATANLVGSLRNGLLIKRRDIDLHVYTDPFRLSDSFAALARLAENKGIQSIQYANLLEAEDRCIEWHASYVSGRGDTWKIDMIHILKGSFYDGYFEKVAERIRAVLTPETREAILAIKNALPLKEPVMGIEIYQAVIEGGVRDERSFRQWREQHPPQGIVTWMP
jgi:hypothetical protein